MKIVGDGFSQTLSSNSVLLSSSRTGTQSICTVVSASRSEIECVTGEGGESDIEQLYAGNQGWLWRVYEGYTSIQDVKDLSNFPEGYDLSQILLQVASYDESQDYVQYYTGVFRIQDTAIARFCVSTAGKAEVWFNEDGIDPEQKTLILDIQERSIYSDDFFSSNDLCSSWLDFVQDRDCYIEIYHQHLVDDEEDYLQLAIEVKTTTLTSAQEAISKKQVQKLKIDGHAIRETHIFTVTEPPIQNPGKTQNPKTH